MSPMPTPDASIWREVGDPLVLGAEDGPLVGERVAVKDLYAVAGSRRGAGNPAWLAQSSLETTTAPVVMALLEAGASVQGIAQTDELAYSLAGTNAHYGTPPNPTAGGRAPGGSSSGSASAVSLGEATIGLGTDTAGSIRVPASYQGLYGIRTTHGLVSREGVLPLAESFDAVGWLSRDARVLCAVGDVLLPAADGAGTATDDLVLVPGLLDLADDDVADVVRAFAAERGASQEHWPLEDLPQWRRAFQALQGWEAWQQHGDWVREHLADLGADVRGRFESAATVTEADVEAARSLLAQVSTALRDLVGDRVLVLPAAPTVAPHLGGELDERLQHVREATLMLTCLAGIGGLPALSLPLHTPAGLPCGVGLLAAPGRDRDLLALAQAWSPRA